MTITPFDGPVGAFSQPSLPGQPAGANPEQGPSFFNMGTMLLDPRPQFTYIPGQNFGKQVSGWIADRCLVIDQAPATATNNNIAAAQTATAGVALTLRTTDQVGITAAQSINRADTGALVTGLLAIDLKQTPVLFGTAQTIQPWDPTEAITRNITIFSTGTDTAGTYVVRGYDLYGFPMSETITGAGQNATATGLKAFKYIASITPAGTVNSTALLVGTGTTIGLPLRVDRFGYLDLTVNNTKITAVTGFTAAVTSTATATSGDVRGTYGMQTAPNGVLTVQAFVSPSVNNLLNATGTGLVGPAQFSA